MMDKYLENVIEITQVYTSLMAEGKLNDDIDSLDYKEAICDWAAEFETLNRKVEWDGVERDYYIEIEQFAREKLLNDFGADEEDEGGEMYLDTPIGQLYAISGDNGVKRYMEIGLGAKGIMDLPLFAIEVPNDESDRIDLYEGIYDSNGEYKGLEWVGDVDIEELNRRTLMIG